jgi:alpha,alpha-trehalose phosphorylase
MGGTWMAMVYGVLGMRDYNGEISFDPRLTRKQGMGRINMIIRGQRLAVTIEPKKKETVYLLKKGEGLTITHQGEEILLAEGTPVTMEINEISTEAQ